MAEYQEFPEEIWEMFMDNLEPTDIGNLFLAFPYFNSRTALQTRKGKSLLEAALPHLLNWKGSSYLKMSDIKNLRLSCKRFKKAVDKHLESQPSLNAHQTSAIPRPIEFQWNTNPHLEILYTGFGATRLFYKPYYGGAVLNTIVIKEGSSLADPESHNNLSYFLQDMASSSKHRNPFVSRSVWINWMYEADTSDPNQILPPWDLTRDEVLQGYKDLDKFHEDFGKHIYFYQLSIPMFEIIKGNLLHYIKSMPNLRSLQYDDSDSEDVSESAKFRFANWLLKRLPNLEYLNTLKIAQAPEAMIQALALRYGKQITRLHYEYFNKEAISMKAMFPNLVELDLMVGVGTGITAEVNILKDTDLFQFFHQITRDHIKKLKLCLSNIVGKGKGITVRIEHFIKKMKIFPNLTYLDIGAQCNCMNLVNGELVLKMPQDCLPKLEYFCFRDNTGLNLDFLACFPSLRNLLILQYSHPAPYAFHVVPTIILREQLQTGRIYDSNIWETLKNLRELKILCALEIEGFIEFSHFNFNRWGYDFTRRNIMQNVEASVNHEFHELRADMLRFLELSAGYDEDENWESDEEEDAGFL